MNDPAIYIENGPDFSPVYGGLWKICCLHKPANLQESGYSPPDNGYNLWPFIGRNLAGKVGPTWRWWPSEIIWVNFLGHHVPPWGVGGGGSLGGAGGEGRRRWSHLFGGLWGDSRNVSQERISNVIQLIQLHNTKLPENGCTILFLLKKGSF